MTEQTQAPAGASGTVEETPAKKPRKQRSDKGKPRGPRKPKAEAAT